MTLAIDVRGLNKSFGDKHVVQDVSLQVEEGKICGFLGPNGSGKTTTLRMLCGLLTPDSGEGTCLGLDIITEANAIKRRAGYMTQKFSLYEDLTIEENLQFSARVHSLDRRKDRVDQALERLGLVERRAQLAGSLSGGWKQRLALSACMIHEPQLLLLDEPTAGVDPMARRDFWDEVHKLAGEGITALISTHYMDEAERCHRIAILDRGVLVADGTPDALTGELAGRTLVVDAAQPRHAQKALVGLSGVISVAQIGNLLRVLMAEDGQAADRIAQSLRAAGVNAQVSAAPANLEDVFVSATRGQPAREEAA